LKWSGWSRNFSPTTTGPVARRHHRPPAGTFGH